jgi:hypothetical protein
MKAMGNQHERTERIEALRVLIAQLSAPDLTLAEATVLRSRLSDLLERDDRPSAWDRMASSPARVPPRSRGDDPRHEAWSPEPSMRAAG